MCGCRRNGLWMHVRLCCGFRSFLCNVHMESTWSELNFVMCLFIFSLSFSINFFPFFRISFFSLSECSSFTYQPVSFFTAALSHLAHFVDLWMALRAQGKVAVTGSQWLLKKYYLSCICRDGRLRLAKFVLFMRGSFSHFQMLPQRKPSLLSLCTLHVSVMHFSCISNNSSIDLW